MRAAVLAAWIAACLISPSFAADTPEQLVTASRMPLYPMRPDDKRAGKLVYRGGLILKSRDSSFGGWSDLVVSADGKRLLAISDGAHWLRATLSYDAKGDLDGIADAVIAPMLNLEGKPLSPVKGDAEGITAVTPREPDGPILVSFERNHRIWRYDLSNGLHGALPSEVPLGPWVKTLRNNSALEAITLLKPDTLLALSEFTRDANGNIVGALEDYPGDPQKPHTRMLGVVQRPPFQITSVTPAPDGGVFLLERRFTIAGGVGMAVRHVNANEIYEGARIEGETLAHLTYQDANIDNMEGLASREGPSGETLLYMISDDNYLPFQQTLLLMFAVEK